MLAFEVAKRLSESAERRNLEDSPVCFLESFNIPHISGRAYGSCAGTSAYLYLAQFLGLLTEAEVVMMEHKPGFTNISRNDVLSSVVCAADSDRSEELGLELSAPARWVDVAYGLQSMAVGYEPSRRVHGIDVFHAVPLN